MDPTCLYGGPQSRDSGGPQSPTELDVKALDLSGPTLGFRISIASVNLDYIKLPQESRTVSTVPSVAKSALDLPAYVS